MNPSKAPDPEQPADLPQRPVKPEMAAQVRGGRAKAGGGDEDDDLNELEVQR